MRKSTTYLFILLALLLACSSDEGGVGQPTPVEVDVTLRAKKLAKGVNIANWFAHNDLSYDNLAAINYSSADFTRLRNAGVTYVRLPIVPDLIFNESNPENISTNFLPLIEAAVEAMLDADLAVVIDMHPFDEFKQRTWLEPSFTPKFAKFWAAVAAHFSQYPADKVFFEILNEPFAEIPNQWYTTQAYFADFIREAAPEHTIIVSGNLRVDADNWNGVEAFTLMEPLVLDNIIYNLHFYDPMPFTHQGSTWVWPPFEFLTNMPYPSTPELVEPLLDDAPNQEVFNVIEFYGQARWNKTKLEEALAPVITWRNQHQVPVTINEIGVFKPVSDNADRYRYLQDLTDILEEAEIGWAMWSYIGGFGIAGEYEGPRNLDAEFVTILN